MLDDQIHKLIAEIYDTTIDAELTSQVLRKICNLTGSTQGIFHYSSAARLQLRTTFGVDPTLMPLGQQYHDQNEYLKRQHLVPVGRAILGSELVPDEEIRKTAFYNEVLRVTGMVHLLGVAILRKADLFTALAVWRSENAEPHGTKERAIADALAVHVHQAFAIGSRMHEVMAQSDRLEDALHALAVGCIILDTRGRLMFANLEDAPPRPQRRFAGGAGQVGSGRTQRSEAARRSAFPSPGRGRARVDASDRARPIRSAGQVSRCAANTGAR